MLTALVLLPVAAAIVVMLIPARRREIHLPLGIALSVMPLALAGYLFSVFEPAAGFQYVDQVTWYEPWGIDWYLGVDGISLPMVVLTALLVPIALAASTDDHQPDEGVRGLHPPARGGDDRGLPGSRPVPLLRLLRGHVDPDVLHHRHLGHRAPGLCRGQVLHLHGLRVGVDAGGDHRSRSHLCAPRKGLPPSLYPIWPNWTSRSGPSGCSSPPLPSPSPSRSRCSRSTPGSPMPTSRRPPRARCCSPPSS